MIAVNELKGKIVSKGMTQGQLADELGMSRRTFSNRLKKGVFNSDEIAKIISILDIKDPQSIFFPK